MECKIMVNRKDNKNVAIYIDKALFEDFKAKLELDNITQKDLLETAILSYLYNDYTLQKNGVKIHCSIEVE